MKAQVQLYVVPPDDVNQATFDLFHAIGAGINILGDLRKPMSWWSTMQRLRARFIIWRDANPGVEPMQNCSPEIFHSSYPLMSLENMRSLNPQFCICKRSDEVWQALCDFMDWVTEKSKEKIVCFFFSHVSH